MSTDEERMAKEQAFLKKHSAVKGDTTFEEAIKEQEGLEGELNLSTAAIEAALTDFLNIKDPLIVDGKAIAMIRRPSMKELKDLFSREFIEAAQNIDDIAKQDPELAERYDKQLYESISNLVAVPKLTAEQWAERANEYFLKAFFEHIGKIGERLQGKIEGF